MECDDEILAAFTCGVTCRRFGIIVWKRKKERKKRRFIFRYHSPLCVCVVNVVFLGIHHHFVVDQGEDDLLHLYGPNLSPFIIIVSCGICFLCNVRKLLSNKVVVGFDGRRGVGGGGGSG